MFSLLFLFYLNEIYPISAVDTVVIPEINMSWTSQTFTIPPGVFPKDIGNYCGTYSKYYCLTAYETKMRRDPVATHYFGHGYNYPPIMPIHEPEEGEERDDLAVEYDRVDFVRDQNLTENISTLKSAVYNQCFEATRAMYRQHNNFIGHGGCCQYQCDNYLVHGYERLFLTPKEYIDKLTDYSEENKTLNLIEAYFSVDCNHRRNVITKLGFGKGELVRANYPFGLKPQRYGYPYLLTSSDDSVSYWFPYSDPRKQLTYWFFKHNVICRDQPWICNQHGAEASTSNHSEIEENHKDELDENKLAEEFLNKHKCAIC